MPINLYILIKVLLQLISSSWGLFHVWWPADSLLPLQITTRPATCLQLLIIITVHHQTGFYLHIFFFTSDLLGLCCTGGYRPHHQSTRGVSGSRPLSYQHSPHLPGKTHISDHFVLQLWRYHPIQWVITLSNVTTPSNAFWSQLSFSNLY